MANLLKVALVNAIVALRQHGWSPWRIARELRIHRKTVARQVKDCHGARSSATLGPSRLGCKQRDELHSRHRPDHPNPGCPDRVCG